MPVFVFNCCQAAMQRMRCSPSEVRFGYWFWFLLCTTLWKYLSFTQSLGFVAMGYIWAIRQVMTKSPWNISQIVFLGCSLHVVALCIVKSVVHNSRNDLWLLLYNLKGLSFMWRAGVTRWCCCIPTASKVRMLPGRQRGTCTQECLCEIERRGQKTHPQPSIAKKRRSDLLIAFMKQTLNSPWRWLQHRVLGKIRWI